MAGFSNLGNEASKSLKSAVGVDEVADFIMYCSINQANEEQNISLRKVYCFLLRRVQLGQLLF